MTNSRRKGRAAEQEVARLLKELLGLEIRRNWQAQSAEGGHDLVGIPGWAIEVKRAERVRLSEWWEQALV